jgi:hypothetical protein
MTPAPRHLARVLVAPELLVSLVTGRFEVVENGLPVGVQVRGAGYGSECRALFVVVEHESFAPVSFGKVIPAAPAPVIRSLDSLGAPA